MEKPKLKFKKSKFYSMMLVAPRTLDAVLHDDGWTDGFLNYFKLYENWHAIHPKVGLALCMAPSRAACAEKAYDILDGRRDEVGSLILKHKERFEAAVAGKENIDNPDDENQTTLFDLI